MKRNSMQRIGFLALLMALVFGCKEKKATLSGDDAVDASDFFGAYTTVKTPFAAADTNLQKIADTTTISYRVFTEFIPDSALAKLAAKKGSRPVFHPVGKIEKDKIVYLLTNVVANKHTALMVFVFDDKNQYLGQLPLIDNKNDDDYLYSVSVNSEPTFMVSRERTKDAVYTYSKTGYAYSKDEKHFIKVVNDSNEDLKNREVLNPVDTLHKKNKFSGDYVKDSRNFISVRDGRNAQNYIFFIHFEKNKSSCVGELKGSLRMVEETKAVYQESGDPCVVDFVFSKNKVQVKEEGSCGNHRGIDCYFNDSYTKKKEAKPEKTKAK